MKVTIGLLIFSLSLVQAREPRWSDVVEAEVQVGENETLTAARLRAINEAQRSAVESTNNVEIDDKTIFQNSQVVTDLVRHLTKGMIIKQEIVWHRPEVQKIGENYFVFWKVRLRALVTPPREVSRDTAFQARISLNKDVFNEGENLELTVKVNSDAYIHIFNVDSEDAVTTLVPNRFHRDNFVRANSTFRFPSLEEAKQGIRLTAALPSNREESEEKVTVIATRRKIDLVGADFREAVYQIYEGKTTGLITQLSEKLYALEDADWDQHIATYRIFRKK